MKARLNANESLSVKYLGNSFTFSSIGKDTVYYMKRIELSAVALCNDANLSQKAAY